ncbi:dihydrofolate reductase family protein [Aeromicrobium sp.]|uniref:dihydrofolate reductase family protein n=1 Tax=Aeromicrobium sp. TaxID=1871063 RepID=UPI003D6B30B4
MDPDLYAYPDTDRPWLRTNFVCTVDGGAYDAEGVTASLGGDADHEVFQLLRRLADVVMVGAGTARVEKYRASSSTSLALVSRRLDIPDDLVGSGLIVITTTDAPGDRISQLREAGVEVIARGEVEIDWTAVLAELETRGWRRILCEGGPTLHGDLVTLDLVDEVCLTIAPTMTSGDAPRIAHSRHPVTHGMRLGHSVAVGDVLLTRWVRDRT